MCFSSYEITTFSAILDTNARLLTGRKFLKVRSSPRFFRWGIAKASFQASRKYPPCSDIFTIWVIEADKISKLLFTRVVEMGSRSHDVDLDFCTRATISSWFTSQKFDNVWPLAAWVWTRFEPSQANPAQHYPDQILSDVFHLQKNSPNSSASWKSESHWGYWISLFAFVNDSTKVYWLSSMRRGCMSLLGVLFSC